jgi:hypothetical protein
MPVGRPGLVLQPGILRPFSLATPHHAAAALGGAAEAGQAAYLASLEQELLDLEAAIAETQAVAAQANADIARLREASAAVAGVYQDAVDRLGGGM